MQAPNPVSLSPDLRGLRVRWSQSQGCRCGPRFCYLLSPFLTSVTLASRWPMGSAASDMQREAAFPRSSKGSRRRQEPGAAPLCSRPRAQAATGHRKQEAERQLTLQDHTGGSTKKSLNAWVYS